MIAGARRVAGGSGCLVQREHGGAGFFEGVCSKATILDGWRLVRWPMVMTILGPPLV